jgi:predicted permease
MLRQALRQLGRRAGLSVVMIVMLALGLGATTAMYSIYHEVLVRPLPVAEPERLVNLGAPGPKWGSASCGIAGDCQHIFSYPMFRDLEARNTAFAGMAGFSEFDANVAFRGTATPATGMLVSGAYFDVLGVRPAQGRLLTPADEPRVGEAAVVVLSYSYWQEGFGADPGAVGQTLTVNGQRLTIVGVAPREFFGTVWGRRPRLFVPLSMRWLMQPTLPRTDETRTAYWVYAFGRLRPSETTEQASASINALYSGILNEVEAPLNTGMPPAMLEQFRRRAITLDPGALGQSDLRSVSTQLTLLLGVTVLVLLIVCANIASLLLARGVERGREMALRASLGASRGRLAGQLLLESVFLATAGAVASVPVALLTLRGFFAISPGWVVDNLTISVGRESLLFAAVAALGTVVLFGLAPALYATRADLGSVIKGQAAQSVGGRSTAGFRRALATVQIALSTVLLALAGLFAQSLANVARVDLGMNVDSLVSFSVAPRLNGYTPERTAELFDRIERELAGVPGVTDVASSSVRLLANESWNNGLSVDRLAHAAGADTDASLSMVSPGFFRTLSVPLVAGRDFTDADRIGAPLSKMLPRVIAGIDPTLPIDELTTVRRTVQENVYLDRLVAILSGGFAAAATLLAAIGLYAVLAHSVVQRTREIGLRLALGATPQALRTMVLKQVGLMAVIGMPVGLAAAVALGHGVGALLYGLVGYDPAVLTAAVATLCAVVAGAAYLPARRAARVAPMEALRYE